MKIRNAMRVLVFALAVLLPSSALAQWNYKGYAQITIDATTGGVPFPPAQISDSSHARPTQAFCFNETGDIRWTIDGTAPTSGIGNLTLAGSALPAIAGTELLSNFRAIRATATTASLSCNFFAGGSLPFREWAPARGSNSTFEGGTIEVTPSDDWAVDPCANTPDDVPIETSTSGNSQLVALSGSQTIYVCGYSFVTDDAVSVQFISGTGTACATGETDETGAMPIATGKSGIGAVGFSGSTVFKTAAGGALCIELSSGVGTHGVVSYKRQ